MKTIRDIEVKDKTVLVRVDYNVPMKEGKITSDLRIRASLPTLEYLRAQGAKRIVLISHLGRPEGRDEKLSLALVAKALDKMVGKAYFSNETTGEEVAEKVRVLKGGEILLLENLRFDKREEENSERFAEEIIEAVKPDFYVQDGFGVLHRAHTSTVAIAEKVETVAGFLVEKEVNGLEEVIKAPKKPVLLIIGGAKVLDKEPLIEKFKGIADMIAVGGKIAADGYKGADEIYVAEDFDEDASGAKLDVGPLATAKIVEMIEEARTVVWNGALGYVEDPAYATASTIVAEAMGEKRDATTVILGGDTTGFVENLMEEHSSLEYSLVSTGGGAALEFLLGKTMPGLEAINIE